MIHLHVADIAAVILVLFIVVSVATDRNKDF